ncbi:MAG: hypothetical protein MJ246_01140 [Clostridia bacterium]|nr:hypothetical protein [Clostridia bacterium]
MVSKISGVWTMHCPNVEQEQLLKFFDKIKGTDDREEFSQKQHEIIMKACYMPRIIKFDDGSGDSSLDDDDLKVVEEVKFYKDCYLKMISLNVSVAYREGIISVKEKEEFDNYVQTLFGY